MTSRIAASMARVASAWQAGDWKLWWLNLYRTNRIGFTLATLGVIVLAGAILGFLTDALMKRSGIDLNSRRTGDR